MDSKSLSKVAARSARRLLVRSWVLTALAACGLAHPASAQEPTTEVPAYARRIASGEEPAPVSAIIQTGCPTCGGLSGAPNITGHVGCSTCGGGGSSGDCGNGCPTGHCYPGKKCGTCNGDFQRPESCGRVGSVLNGVFDCLCCKDPCYDPCWVPAANAAFFQDAARPRSQMRLRWDMGYNMTQPDRNEWFWARSGGGGKGPARAETRVDYQELTLYNETATGGFGFFIEMPYRAIHPEINDFNSGFGDMNLGTKSMFVDCELMQLTFQFRTFIPIGATRSGLGNGHVTLEPSLLSTFKLTNCTYLQQQISEWIPIGGDSDYAGMVLHYHTSLNHSWWKRGPWELVGTLEFNGWTFQDGAFTEDDGTQFVRSNRESYLSAGPGARLHFCEYLDVGVGSAFALTDDSFGEQIYRVEFRVRY